MRVDLTLKVDWKSVDLVRADAQDVAISDCAKKQAGQPEKWWLTPEDLVKVAERFKALTAAAELRAVATWIRTPGNINSDDAIDECARTIENRARTLEKKP
jgi:hypothetical protein